MSNFENSKRFGTKAYPVQANLTSNLLARVEPIISPDALLSRYLKNVEGIESYSKEELNQEIILAMNEFELMSNLSLTKVQHRERVPFDRDLYRSFVYMKLEHGPILSIEEVLIESSNGENIFQLPADWIDAGFLHKRQVNLIPILSIFGASPAQASGQPSNAGLIFIQAISNFRWIPAFYTVKYTVGISHTEGQLPIVVNDVVGMTAAIKILSELQSREKYNSSSISQDGISQSASGPGNQRYKPRIDDLMERREKMLAKIKAVFNQKYFLSNI